MLERDIATLARADAVRSVIVRPSDGGGWILLVNDQVVRSARNPVRPFRSLDTVATTLGRLGIRGFSVRLPETG